LGIRRRGGDVIRTGEHRKLTLARAIALRSGFSAAELDASGNQLGDATDTTSH